MPAMTRPEYKDLILNLWAYGMTGREIHTSTGFARSNINRIVARARDLKDPRAVKRRACKPPKSLKD
jgi:hypothetical protein